MEGYANGGLAGGQVAAGVSGAYEQRAGWVDGAVAVHDAEFAEQ